MVLTSDTSTLRCWQARVQAADRRMIFVCDSAVFGFQGSRYGGVSPRQRVAAYASTQISILSAFDIDLSLQHHPIPCRINSPEILDRHHAHPSQPRLQPNTSPDNMPPTTSTPHGRTIMARDSISTTPLVIIPMLCIAIFALIIYYTLKEKREKSQGPSPSGRRPPRSRSSRTSTGAWVRGVRSSVRNKSKKKARAGGQEMRPGTGNTRTYMAARTADTHSEGDFDSYGQLSTIEEEFEAETGKRWIGGRRDDAQGSPTKSPLKGGRRPSSTIRAV